MKSLLQTSVLLVSGLFFFAGCSPVRFSTNASSADGVTSAPPVGAPAPGSTPSPTPCSTSAFGNLCSGTPSPTPPAGAHAFLYDLIPIPNAKGYTAQAGKYAGIPEAGSMSLLTSQDVIPNLNLYTTDIDVPLQDWSAGFPQDTTLTEWFGVCYDGSWNAPTNGSYTFVTAVDDAIAILIDGNLVGENDDGISSAAGATFNSNLLNLSTNGIITAGPIAFSTVNLAQGLHEVEVFYYQGWPVQLEEIVWVYPPGSTYPGGGATPPNSNLMQLGAPKGGVLNCPH